MGELKAGQEVIVVRSSNDSRRRSPDDIRLPARIVKVNRVWIELERTDTAPGRLGVRQTWRMRQDTQNEGSEYSGNDARFVTLEQDRWERNRNWAKDVLRRNGVDLRLGSPWQDREFELAEFIAESNRKVAP